MLTRAWIADAYRALESSERLVDEARARQTRPMDRRDRHVVGSLSVGFALACAALLTFLPEGEGRSQDPWTLALLVVVFALVSRVEFEIGSGYAVPDMLAFVPMLFLAPLPLVPVLVAGAFVLSALPDVMRGRLHPDRLLGCLGDSWFAIGPAIVLAVLGPGEPMAGLLEIYVLAFAAYVATGLGPAILREHLVHGLSVHETLRAAAWSLRIDAILAPVGFMAAVLAFEHPASLVAIGPLVWLLAVFSRERKARYAAAIELNRAYRGTVMLLSDVVESQDTYTADHCRSVVDLVTAVADEMGVHPDDRQELEFAALLHDVGKIAIPKDILNKPAALSEEEFELMKTHTVEGQVMLERVGGLLERVGTIVRSCHERWDGGGYPDGLAGEQIPRPARIVFACDAYNAMTTDRPYRRSIGREAAVKELWANAGSQFDPAVVAALTAVVYREAADPVASPAEALRQVIAGGRAGALASAGAP